MLRLITRTILILVACVALALVVLHVARASGTGYSADPASSAQPPAATQYSPQSPDTSPSYVNVTGASSTSATPLPAGTAEPQGQAEPQEAAEPLEAAEPQGQAEPQETAEPQGQAEPQDIVMGGTVASSDSTHSAFTLRTSVGTVTVLVTGQTEYSDGFYRLADIHAGMNVSVDVYRQTNGSLVATDVKASSESSDPSGTDSNVSDSSSSAADGN